MLAKSAKIYILNFAVFSLKIFAPQKKLQSFYRYFQTRCSVIVTRSWNFLPSNLPLPLLRLACCQTFSQHYYQKGQKKLLVLKFICIKNTFWLYVKINHSRIGRMFTKRKSYFCKWRIRFLQYIFSMEFRNFIKSWHFWIIKTILFR